MSRQSKSSETFSWVGVILFLACVLAFGYFVYFGK